MNWVVSTAVFALIAVFPNLIQAENSVDIDDARMSLCASFRREAQNGLGAIAIGRTRSESWEKKLDREVAGDKNQSVINQLVEQINAHYQEERSTYQTVAALVSLYDSLGCPRNDLVEALYCHTVLEPRYGCTKFGKLGSEKK